MCCDFDGRDDTVGVDCCYCYITAPAARLVLASCSCLLGARSCGGDPGDAPIYCIRVQKSPKAGMQALFQKIGSVNERPARRPESVVLWPPILEANVSSIQRSVARMALP
jgi:hypothetical protein